MIVTLVQAAYAPIEWCGVCAANMLLAKLRARERDVAAAHILADLNTSAPAGSSTGADRTAPTT